MQKNPKFYPENSDFSNVKAIFNIYISMYENLLAPKPMAPKQSFNISKHSMWKYENSKITKHVFFILCMHSNLKNLIRHSVWYNFFSRVKQSEAKEYEREGGGREWGLSIQNASNDKRVVMVVGLSKKRFTEQQNTRKLRKHFVWTFNFN